MQRLLIADGKSKPHLEGSVARRLAKGRKCLSLGGMVSGQPDAIFRIDGSEILVKNGEEKPAEGEDESEDSSPNKYLPRTGHVPPKQLKNHQKMSGIRA